METQHIASKRIKENICLAWLDTLLDWNKPVGWCRLVEFPATTCVRLAADYFMLPSKYQQNLLSLWSQAPELGSLCPRQRQTHRIIFQNDVSLWVRLFIVRSFSRTKAASICSKSSAVVSNSSSTHPQSPVKQNSSWQRFGFSYGLLKSYVFHHALVCLLCNDAADLDTLKRLDMAAQPSSSTRASIHHLLKTNFFTWQDEISSQRAF